MISILFPVSRLTLIGTLIVVAYFTLELRADDWPQWRGPNRDGVWRETGIVNAIPPGALKVRWRAKVGRGYSGPVVSDGSVFVTDQVFNPEVERVLCFEEVTGKPVWTHSYPVDYENMEYGNGPRASPTVHDGRVYTLGTQGDFCCLDAATGDLFWKKDLQQDYDAAVPQYGAGVAPLVEGDLVIVCIGGQPDASVIAFDLVSGEERWRSLSDEPAYSAPIVIDRGGCRQAIVWTADNIVSLNPTNGEVYWKEEWKTTFDAAQVVATPVLHKDRLLFVMAWNRGSRMLQLDATTPAASVLWTTRTRPTTTMSTPIMVDDDYFCSIDNVGGLCCLDANTGDEVWRTTEVAGSSALGHAHLTPNGRQVFLFNQRGQLISARLTPAGYEETGRALLVEPTAAYRAQGPVAWAHPAYANRHVIARNDRMLVSVSLDAAHYPAADKPVAESDVKAQVLSDYVGRNSALALDYSPDGQTLALGTWGGNITLRDVSSGNAIQPAPESFRNNCCDVAFSPNGQLLACVGGTEFEQDGDLRRTVKLVLWDVAAGKLRSDLAGHTSKVTCVVFSPDGKTFATASADQTIRLWDSADGTERAVLRGHTDAVWSLAYAADGETLISVGWDRTMKFWNVMTGVELGSIEAHDEEILSVAVSPDGSTIATGSGDWTVRLWSVATRERMATLNGHHGSIYCVAFSPDGQTLATGSGDETIKLWDVKAAKERTTLVGHRSGITALTFSPDGSTLASAGRDDPVRLWKLADAK
ncbi:MAG TPA: hypothetical protein EYG03_10130 [Planctomycetes bacterium]|nr:hypothetical protein [Planctomycetota bacterium]